ncbi:major facilitator superfamily domain-containing protein 4A isoform X1 [Hyalella azteca]|uniref:Major facilitator superfamily domain-containing protein 4A isoform X1 n=1 Tax=Hyalella azteca TaxID=294128 RepID=A0A979FPA9_HYAAZ|nr:major facilitator superfamily domain-containing protein 4A isoform X1 [Hyalella azteca]
MDSTHSAFQEGATTHEGAREWENVEYDRTSGVVMSNGGVDVTGHAKELCVNKLGHTMVTPPEGGTSRGRFRELFGRHRLKTVTYCAVFWSLGMGVAFLGPTLLDLECRISSVFSSMSWVFFSQSLFTLIGSACGGFMVQSDCFVKFFDHFLPDFPRITEKEREAKTNSLGLHLVLLGSVVMFAVTLTVVPECSVLGALITTLAVMGFFMGTIDTVANISMLQLYGRDVAPFLQALHFSYGLGAFLSPIVTKPFLLNEDCNGLVLNSSVAHRLLDVRLVNITQEAQAELHHAQNNSEIQYAFWIMALMQLPVVVLLAVLVYYDYFPVSGDAVVVETLPETFELKTQNITEPLAASRSIMPDLRDEEDRPQVTARQMALVTACAAGLLFIYDGLQAAYGGYIYSYAVKSVADMAQNEAAVLNACFWGTFAFGRLISIGIATRITPQWMMLANMTGCFVAMVLMLSMPHDHAMLYVGTGLFGTFLSSVFPTTVSMTETYIHVTSQITSVLVMSAALGEMVFPVIIGHEFDSSGPKVLLISGVVMTLLSFVLYFALFIVADGITRVSSERSLTERFKALLKGKTVSDEGIGLMTHNVKHYNRMRSHPSDISLNEETSLSTAPVANL